MGTHVERETCRNFTCVYTFETVFKASVSHSSIATDAHKRVENAWNPVGIFADNDKQKL